MKTPIAIDLFAGCGGFSLGVKQAGFKVILAVEKDKYACDTYALNHKDTFLICDDIKNVDMARIHAAIGIRVKELDLLFGGPPCQGFSTISKTRGLNDPRSKLMREFIRMVKELQPKLFMIENVPGLLSYKDFFILLMQTLENLGYVVRTLMMDAVNYGVPQYRKRVFIQGVRNDCKFLPSFPPPTHFDLSKKFKNALLRPDALAVKCFALNGYTKEQVKDLYWNDILEIQMNRKTAADIFDRACNELIAEIVFQTIQKYEPIKRHMASNRI